MKHGREDTLINRKSITHQDICESVEPLVMEDEYTALVKARVQQIVKNIPMNGLFLSGTCTVDQVSAYRFLNEFRQAGQRIAGLVQDLLNTQRAVALPLRLLPDVFAAAPVLYAYKTKEDSEPMCREPLTEDVQRRKGIFHPALRSICDTFPNQQWRDLVQIFNRVCRGMDRYDGETIPKNLQECMKRAAEICDDVFVATPYHEVAVRDLERVRPWTVQRVQSPYVFGTIRGVKNPNGSKTVHNVPFVVLLGRTSGDSLFSAYPAMVADTVEFLRANTKAFKVLNGTDRFSWYYGDSPESIFNVPLGTRLGNNVEKMMQMFHNGFLFDWLKEGYSERV
jgi:hypothetical protein